jgi:hypothetical protein
LIYMILAKNITAKRHLSEILSAVAGYLAAAGEVLTIGRIIKDNDGDRAGKNKSET